MFHTFTATSASTFTITGTWATLSGTANWRDMVVTQYRSLSSVVSSASNSGGLNSNNPTLTMTFTTGTVLIVIATVNSAITSTQMTTDFRDSGNLVWDGYENGGFTAGSTTITWTGLVNDCWSMVGIQLVSSSQAFIRSVTQGIKFVTNEVSNYNPVNFIDVAGIGLFAILATILIIALWKMGLFSGKKWRTRYG